MIEAKCSSYLSTKSLSPNVEALILKEHGVPMDAHLILKYIKEKFSETTAVQDSREVNCLTKPVRSIVKIGQTGMAKSAGSRL
jgi:shikimate kinase